MTHRADDAIGAVPLRCCAVAVAVLAGNGPSARVLVVQRGQAPFAGEWSLITGRIDTGEAAWEAAVREIQEEAGLIVPALYSTGYCDQFYSPRQECVEIVPVFVAVVPRDSHVTLNDENTDFRWMEIFDAAEAMAFHGHRVALGIIAREFLSRAPADWRRIDTYRP